MLSGEGNGTPLQYSCLENPMDRGAWWAAVHGVATEQLHFHFHFHALEKEMATHSSVLAWRIPGTGEPGGPPSTGSHRVGPDWSDLAVAAAANGAICWGGKLGAEGHRNQTLLAFSIFKINSWVWLPRVLVVPRGISVASWDSSVNRVPTLSCFETCGILIPQPGIEPPSPALQSDS